MYMLRCQLSPYRKNLLCDYKQTHHKVAAVDKLIIKKLISCLVECYVKCPQVIGCIDCSRREHFLSLGNQFVDALIPWLW